MGAGRRQSEALPSRRHHEPDPQEANELRQEAAGTPAVLELGPDGDPRGRRGGGPGGERTELRWILTASFMEHFHSLILYFCVH